MTLARAAIQASIPEQVLARMEHASGDAPAVVLFDIDDTLTLAEGRNRRILLEFAADPDARARFGAALDALAAVSAGPVRYALTDTLALYGLTATALVEAAQAFWKPRFFRNDYFALDPPVAGAPGFVREVASRGTVVYITGRWEALRPGTEAALRASGFPAPDGKRVLLVMKPDESIPDAAFKDAKLAELKGIGRVVAGFENEPKNVNVFKKHFPDALIVFLNTQHSAAKDTDFRVVEPLPGIPWIADYR